VALALQLEKFAKAGFEYFLHAHHRCPTGNGALVQIVDIRPTPEFILEALRFTQRGAYREQLAEDEIPGQKRRRQQDQQNQLNHHAGVRDQA
jgi:hypothetical protein